MKGKIIVAVIFAVLFLVSCSEKTACPACTTPENVFVAQFQQGIQPDSDFSGISDISLFESNTSLCVPSAVISTVTAGSGSRVRSVFKFDLRGYLPSNITVKKATLTLNGTVSGTVTLESHVMTQECIIASASWGSNGVTAWTSGGGGTYEATASGSTTFISTDSQFSVELDPATIKGTITDAIHNNGVILTMANDAAGTSSFNFNSSDYASTPRLRPVLTVYYTVN
jgi:hypothetical protein